MKLTQTTFHGYGTGGKRIEKVRVVETAEAVQIVINRTMGHYEGERERDAARSEALQGMLARLLDKLIANGALRAEQVSEIFDYDVIAETE